MKGFLVVFAFTLVLPSPMRPELPSESLSLKATTPTAPTSALDEAFQKISLARLNRVHINESPSREEGSRFRYRPDDMYDDCADEMDALARTKEPIDERLLHVANKSNELAERYRAVWILIQRRNAKLVPILEKMAGSSSAEERYLTWHVHTMAIRERQHAVPQVFDAILAHCRKEKNKYVQEQIVYFLGACEAKEAIPLLTGMLNNDYDGLCVVHALGEIRDPKTVPAIIACAKKATHNRHIYFAAVGRIGTPEAVDYLIEHLDEGCFAVDALFESGSPKALPAIERYLYRLKKMTAPDELDVAAAQVSVLRLNHTDPREQLLALAEDRKQSHWMRTRAMESLGHYDRKPLTDRIVKLYRTDPDDSIRMFCIRLLSDLPGKNITDAMIDQALTDQKDTYYHSHYNLVGALIYA